MIKFNKNLFLITAGSSLEYYDFVLYGLLANYIGKKFFPPVDNNIAQLIQTYSIFALGYLVRPISGTILGLIADKYSRIKVFSFSMLLMGIATFSMGIIPSYDTIGMAAPLLLALARLTQGISFASELPGAITILSDSYIKKHFSIATSIGYLIASTGFGFILASFIVYLLKVSMTEYQILNWGWRIPFIIGGLLAFISYYIRRSLENTEVFRNYHLNQIEKPIISIFYDVFIINYISILRGIGITSLIATGTIFFIYLPHLLEEIFFFNSKDINLYFLIGLITFTFFCFLFGKFLEKINFKKFFLIIALSFPAIIYFIILQIKIIESNLSLFILFVLYEIYMAALFVSGLRILSQLFTISLRNTSISFCYNISFSIFSFSPAIFMYCIQITKKPESICILFLILSILASLSISSKSNGKI